MICTDGMTVGMCLCVLLAASSLIYYWMNAYCIVMSVYCAFIWILYRYRFIYVSIYITLYHNFLALIILQDMAFVWLCCAIWWCFADCLFLSLIYHYVYACMFTLAIFLSLLHGDSFSQVLIDCMWCWCKHAHFIYVTMSQLLQSLPNFLLILPNLVVVTVSWLCVCLLHLFSSLVHCTLSLCNLMVVPCLAYWYEDLLPYQSLLSKEGIG